MLLTEIQAARELQTDKKTVRRLIETGRLKAVDVGGGKRRHYRIDPAELRAIAPASRIDPRTPPTCRRRRRLSLPQSVAAYLPSV